MSPTTIEVQLDSDVGAYTMQVIEGDYFKDVLATRRPYEEEMLRITTALTRSGDRIVDVARTWETTPSTGGLPGVG